MTADAMKRSLSDWHKRQQKESEARRCARRDRIVRRVCEWDLDDPSDERMRRDEDEMTRDLARTSDGRPR